MGTILNFPPVDRNISFVASTNSPKNTPDSGVPLIDTIRLTGPISRHDMRIGNLTRFIDNDGVVHDVERSWRGEVDGARIQVRPHPRSGEMWASIERSVPTFLYGHNATSATLAEMDEVARYFYEQAAASLVDWSCDVGSLEVSRLDLDRDFDGVHDKNHLMRSHSTLRAPKTGNAHLYFDPSRGGAQTLVRGPKSGHWRGTLYDKHAQLMSLATSPRNHDRRGELHRAALEASTRVRFEVVLRRSTLRSAGLVTLDSLSHSVLADRLHHYFSRCRFDTPVGGQAVIDQLHVRLAMSEDPDLKFLGSVQQMLQAERLGVPCKLASDTRSRYRRLAREWGISAADTILTDTAETRLDFNTGLAVVA